jgi:hypothetical protein
VFCNIYADVSELVHASYGGRDIDHFSLSIAGMPTSTFPVPREVPRTAGTRKVELPHVQLSVEPKHRHSHGMEMKSEGTTESQVRVAILTVSDTVATGAGPDRR